MTPDVYLTAYRHAYWGGSDGSEEVVFLGEDLTDATFAWSFALASGGEVAITLTNAEAGAQGVSVSYDPDYLHPVRGVAVGASILVPQIDSATLKALATSPDATSDDLVLWHTLYVTRSGAEKQALFSGTFTIRQGAPN